MRVQAGILGTLYGVVVFSGSALSDLFEVKEAVEETICKKLATNYKRSQLPFCTGHRAIANLSSSNIEKD